MSTCGDRDKTIETALSLGRKVEVFPVDDRNVDEMRERVKDAFDIAWADGVFKVRDLVQNETAAQAQCFRP